MSHDRVIHQEGGRLPRRLRAAGKLAVIASPALLSSRCAGWGTAGPKRVARTISVLLAAALTAVLCFKLEKALGWAGWPCPLGTLTHSFQAQSRVREIAVSRWSESLPPLSAREGMGSLVHMSARSEPLGCLPGGF